MKQENKSFEVGALMLAVMVAVLALFSAFGAPHFVTPEMTLRNGLTDEQYEKLWAIGRSPRISPNAARDWIFRASRYENATNWFGIIGKTNDFARLCMVQKETIYTNEATIAALAASNGWLSAHYRVAINRLESALAELRPLRVECAALNQQMTNGLYAVWKTDDVYRHREETAPDEKLRTIYHEMRDYLAVIRNEFETPPNKE